MRARPKDQETHLQKLDSSCPPLCSLRRANVLTYDTTHSCNTSSCVHVWAESLACLLLDPGTGPRCPSKEGGGLTHPQPTTMVHHPTVFPFLPLCASACHASEASDHPSFV